MSVQKLYSFYSSTSVRSPSFLCCVSNLFLLLSVVDNFINRGEYNSIKNGPNGRYNSYKSIVKTNGNVKLGIHTHTYNNITVGKNVSFNEENTPLLINHYAIQSKDYWQKIKMVRGDCDYYYDIQGWERNMQLFKDMDVNEILDERLKNQNIKIV